MRKHITVEKNIPGWVFDPKTRVDFFGHLGATEPTAKYNKITSKPWLLGRTWCVMIDGVSGGVSIGCLEPVTDQAHSQSSEENK